jgi:hypothetical protein
MSAISLSVSNVKELQAAIKSIGGKAEANVGKAVKATGLGITHHVENAISRGTKSGHLYFRIPGEKYMTVRQGAIDGPIVAVFRASGKQNLSLTHRASAPGEAPATDTGALVSSIYTNQVSPLSLEVGSRLAYAYYLEFGTVKIKRRPSWMPAVEANRDKFIRLIEEGLRRAMA